MKQDYDLTYYVLEVGQLFQALSSHSAALTKVTNKLTLV